MTAYFTKLKPFAAPKSYTFVDPDTKHIYHGKDKKELFFYILSYREQNNLPPIEALDTVLDNYWCSLPENTGNCERIKLRRGWLPTLKGGIALLENLYYGKDNLLTPEEAEKRAQVCIKCPHNVFPDKDKFIAWSDEIAEAATFGLRCPSYTKLGNCFLCSCPLKALVFSKKANLLETETDERTKYPSYCWKLKSRKEEKEK